MSIYVFDKNNVRVGNFEFSVTQNVWFNDISDKTTPVILYVAGPAGITFDRFEVSGTKKDGRKVVVTATGCIDQKICLPNIRTLTRRFKICLLRALGR